MFKLIWLEINASRKGQAGVGSQNQMTILRAAAAAACSGSTAGISRKTAVCKFPGHSGPIQGRGLFLFTRRSGTSCDLVPTRAHRTKSLRILCNIYRSRKQMNFAPRVSLQSFVWSLVPSYDLKKSLKPLQHKKKKRQKKFEILI